jgi:bacterial/archaeal transporter family protein
VALLLSGPSAGRRGKGGPIDKLSVVLVAVFGAAFLGEHLTLTSWFVVLLIGVVALTLPRQKLAR